jgi:hypothetical protein
MIGTAEMAVSVRVGLSSVNKNGAINDCEHLASFARSDNLMDKQLMPCYSNNNNAAVVTKIEENNNN